MSGAPAATGGSGRRGGAAPGAGDSQHAAPDGQTDSTATTAAMPVVALDDVRFTRAEGFALHVARLRLAAGEALACVGPSGCGKTTLVELVAGILVPQQGRARLLGVDLGALSDEGRRAHRIAHVGFVFQRFALLEHLTGLENVLLPYHVSRALRLDDAARERALELAHTLGVAHALPRKPERLSQGERQRLAICRALVTEPDLLLADEPTGNLDPARSAETMELLVSQARRRGTGLLVATHDHGLLDRFDRVLVVGDTGEVRDTGEAQAERGVRDADERQRERGRRDTDEIQRERGEGHGDRGGRNAGDRGGRDA